jgi:hypothetical protein
LSISVRLRNLIRGGQGPIWARAPLKNNNKNIQVNIHTDFSRFFSSRTIFSTFSIEKYSITSRLHVSRCVKQSQEIHKTPKYLRVLNFRTVEFAVVQKNVS